MSGSRPLDPTLYALTNDEASFFKSQTGIEDDVTLKSHISEVQEEAYKICPYPCIRRFAFTKMYISRYPCYQRFLNLGKERKGAIYADIGCCFGNDPRKAVLDGYPVKQVLASDLRPEFWDLGHRLFRSTPDNFPARFIPADIFQLEDLPKKGDSVSELSQVKSMGELRGSISAIHTSALFHLFEEERQLELARNLAALLSSEPGSMIFGSHGGRPKKGIRIEVAPGCNNDRNMFCHSPESWRSLWDGEVFPRGTVRVDVSLDKTERPDMVTLDPSVQQYLLVWCITIL
ncbi:uncharacterized protein BT62DRAFT_992643 [Guyanagaster necrorhizus]|uniref:Methyltransferase ausD n=1 Tax=Guyanagaster necrorhizus TaxID=856835 RepID=A0A9P7VY60_9AGAR|nr:uncharacterized protein BT62DRAFT_992643 [Guyanagaster necrorhizus MCA 3950]KAG7448620.1 hypothetical protein BT62DRAFT_992643 [Guyanagaster necrorhizus MCA 3950]